MGIIIPALIVLVMQPFPCYNVKNRSSLPNLAQPYCSNPIFIDIFAPHEQEEEIDISVYSGV